MGDIPVLAYFSEGLPEGTPAPTERVKMFVFPRGESPPRRSSPEMESASTPIEAWSPASAHDSTPNLDSRQVSPSRLRGSRDARELRLPAGAGSDVNCEDLEPRRNDADYISSSRRNPQLREMLSFFAKRRFPKVDSAESPAPSPEPASRLFPSSTVVVELVSPNSGVVPSARLRSESTSSSSEYASSQCAPFGGRLSATPSVEDGQNDDKAEEDMSSPMSAPAATKRTEAEGDMEEGGVSATMAAARAYAEAETAAEGAIPTPSALAAVSASASVANTAVVEPVVLESEIVLPCAPSNEEKVCYHKTGRLFLVTTGTLAFCVSTVGMWLFTLASPYFFWFGAPTVFLMFYLVFHYFVVAMWGKDFDPDAHDKVVKEAVDEAFLPTVDVFLPVCNEDLALLNNTWKYVSTMDYPHYSVYVLDDGAKDDVRVLAAEYGFQYIRRDNRPEMKKAGNLRYAFARTSGDAVVIFDADFCPRSDFLRETTPYLLNSEIGILQTPQFFRWREEQTWVEQGAGSCQEFFYRMVQMNQDKFNGSVCVGSCGLYRRSAIQPFGGVVPISHSEDMYTGFKMTELGHKIKYLPLCLAMGICPDEPRSFFMQQYRWCMGSATLVFEKGFWSAKISIIHKICFFNGLLYYIATALLLFLAPMPIILLIFIKADSVLWYYSGFAVPSIAMSAIVLPFWSKQPYGMSCHRVRVIQCYAHLYALKDRIMGTAAVWIPSGGGASRSSSKAYNSSVWLMLTWTTLCTVLIVGGSLWRMTEFTWYHYVPAVVLALGSFYLNISTLWY